MQDLTLESIIFRLSITLITTGIIGYNRLKSGQAAGLRTHVLVGIGACIISLVQVSVQMRELGWAFENPELASLVRSDGTRLVAQIISGIGFLGAGTIIVTNNITVSGLTTAASLWTSAGIGISIGLGFLEIGVVGTVFVWFSLVFLNKLKTEKIYTLDIRFNKPRTEMKDLFKLFDAYHLKLEDMSFSGEGSEYHYQFRLIGDREHLNTTLVSKDIWSSVSNVVSLNFH